MTEGGVEPTGYIAYKTSTGEGGGGRHSGIAGNIHYGVGNSGPGGEARTQAG